MTPRIRSSLISVSVTLLAALFSGCVSDHTGLQSFSIQSNVLTTLTRADGSPLPDVVAAIESAYGFRAQAMNFVVPGLTIDLTSSLDTAASQATAKTIVTDWATVTSNVVNDAQAIPVAFKVNGVEWARCGDCAFDSMLDAYGDFFAGEVKKGLLANMRLRIVGVDMNGQTKVESLAPAVINYYCVVDKTLATQAYDSWKLEKAVSCSGTVEFRMP